MTTKVDEAAAETRAAFKRLLKLRDEDGETVNAVVAEMLSGYLMLKRMKGEDEWAFAVANLADAVLTAMPKGGAWRLLHDAAKEAYRYEHGWK